MEKPITHSALYFVILLINDVRTISLKVENLSTNVGIGLFI